MASEVLVPPLGQTVDTVTLVTWYRKEGELVTQGDPLFAIETDKATLDVEAPASGMLQQVRAQPGDVVKALSAIALITAPGDLPVPTPPLPREEAAQSASPAPLSAGGGGSPLPSAALSEERRTGRIFVSPRARRLAEEQHIPLTAIAGTGPQGAIVERDVRAYLMAQSEPSITPVARRVAEEAGLDWRRLTGTGPGGRITRDDVDRALAATSTALAPPADRVTIPTDIEVGQDAILPHGENEALEVIPLRSVRAVIAERMALSATTAAQVTLTAEADATALVELRRQLIQDGVAASYNTLFLYVLGRALREHPQLNASLEGEAIKLWRRIHIGLAVDTPRGLLVPVLRDVDRKGVSQLAEETHALVERARQGQCTPAELSGGTFTLTNLGMFGIDAFAPLINLPECAILGVGRIKKQPVIVADQVVGREMVWLSLTFDHRLVDGGPAAQFLQRVVQLVERPHLLIT